MTNDLKTEEIRKFERARDKMLSDEFEELTTPLIEFLRKNYHPHVGITIDCGSAQLVEMLFGYLRDDEA